MTTHSKRTREASLGLWYVWCTCSWNPRYLTKHPDLVYAKHAKAQEVTRTARNMTVTPNDYRSRA